MTQRHHANTTTPAWWRARTGILLLLLLLPLLGAVALPAARAQETATVTFGFWGDPAEEAAYEQVIAEFEAANPEIDVEALYTPGQDEFQTRLATSFGADSPPDVFLINFRRYGQYAARDALEPLGPRLAASEVISEEDFYDIPIEAFRYNGGELFCIPQNISSLVVYYNVDMFNAAGVPLPADDWTWDDFVQTALALTVDEDGDGFRDQHGLVVDPSFIRYVPFIWGAGGEIVDDTDQPTELLLDSPEAQAGIQWFMDLGIQNHNVVPSEAEILAEDQESRFMNGRAAMLMQSRRVVPTLREIEEFTWDVAPLPTGEQQAGILHSDAFCMAATTEDKDAAWRFIEFAVSEAGQTILAETGRTVPSLISVAESPVFLGGGSVLGVLGDAASAPPANSHAFLDTIPSIRRVPSISTWPEIEDAFNTVFKRAFYEEIALDAALDVVEEQSRGAFERAAEEYE